MFVVPAITVKEETLKVIDKFMYLHSILSRPAIINKDANSCSAKVRSAFKWLCESVWEKRGIQLTMTLKVYRAVVLSSLLYTCETWTVYITTPCQKLNCLHLNCLRELLKFTKHDKVPDTGVLFIAGLLSIHALFKEPTWPSHSDVEIWVILAFDWPGTFSFRAEQNSRGSQETWGTQV